ncbi:MAG: hypothetical protein D6775_03475 [Caldilineae bacterium]|nr:MAG: hypothetical protein D6775_03475 [Caldilineae bacterium]
MGDHVEKGIGGWWQMEVVEAAVGENCLNDAVGRIRAIALPNVKLDTGERHQGLAGTLVDPAANAGGHSRRGRGRGGGLAILEGNLSTGGTGRDGHHDRIRDLGHPPRLYDLPDAPLAGCQVIEAETPVAVGDGLQVGASSDRLRVDLPARARQFLASQHDDFDTFDAAGTALLLSDQLHKSRARSRCLGLHARRPRCEARQQQDRDGQHAEPENPSGRLL